MSGATGDDILDLKLKKTKKSHLGKSDELLKSLESTIGTVKPKLNDRNEEGEQPSLFYNNRSTSTKVSMDQLLASMDEKSSKKFKNVKESMENYQKCVQPENSEQVKKRTRQQAYKTNVKDMKKWDHVIHQYRDAKKIKFDSTHDIQLEPTLDDWIDNNGTLKINKNHTTSNSTNNKLIDMLGKLSNRERRALHKLQLQKVLEQRNQLRKLRLFESNNNIKNNYIRKIKSKNFRRRLRFLKKKREANDIGETQEEMDSVRAEERALLKHKKKSKWEKRMKTLSNKLPEAKEALIQHQEISKKLVNETKAVGSDDDEDDDDAPSDSHHANLFRKHLTNQQKLNLVNNPWLTEQVREDEIYEIPEDNNDPKTRFRSLVPINRVTNDSSDQFDLLMNSESDLDTRQQLFSESEEECDRSDDTDGDSSDAPPQAEVINMTEEDKQMRAIVDAFGDNVIGREFANEVKTNRQRLKNEILAQAKDAAKPLPGWGSWVSDKPSAGKTGSASLRRKDRKKNAPSKKDPLPPLVIKNNSKNLALEQIRVNKVPRGFANDKQIFNNSIRQPVGQLFNTPKTFKVMIQPKIQTKPGTIIQPLESDAKGQCMSKVKALLRDMPKDMQNKLKSIL